jgi:alkylation response protein AidB-like acyl-CoA dehydrogenase
VSVGEPALTVVDAASDELVDAELLRQQLRAWLGQNDAGLARFRSVPSSLGEQVEHLLELQRTLFDAGWQRWGWPAEVGGNGGTPLHRAVIAEELAVAGFPPPFSFGMIETLAPGVLAHAPELAMEFVPRLLSGEEVWCQGFSEPDAGSDLASLRTRAVARDDGTFVISGQKVWTSFAQFADRCVLLARTRSAAARHAGVTAFFVDMDADGLEVRPLRAMTGVNEFCELYLNDVVVPSERVIGVLDGGWGFVRHVLASERGAVGLQRQAWMRYRLADLVSRAGDRLDAGRLGRVYMSLCALRLCTRRSLLHLASGELPGPETSIDKLMISSTEQALLDLAFEALGPEIVGSDAPVDASWRSDYLYSRAASIYGGTSEIQRDIIAQRLLTLPRPERLAR